MPVKVGVLALQGGFSKHISILKSIDVETLAVRHPQELTECDALIIPGGESTTIFRQIHFINMWEPLNEFARQKPVMGTCAGLILMSREILNDPRQPFGWLDVAVERNAYGRQADSFKTTLEATFDEGKPTPVEALFIRAPRIRKVGREVKVLSSYDDEAVLVEQGHFLGLTFHPELADEAAVHKYFISMI